VTVGRVIAVLRDRLLLLSLLVEQFVLTLINEDYYYYYNTRIHVCILFKYRSVASAYWRIYREQAMLCNKRAQYIPSPIPSNSLDRKLILIITTTQNSFDNLPSYLQTNIIAEMLSVGG